MVGNVSPGFGWGALLNILRSLLILHITIACAANIDHFNCASLSVDQEEKKDEARSESPMGAAKSLMTLTGHTCVHY